MHDACGGGGTIHVCDRIVPQHGLEQCLRLHPMGRVLEPRHVQNKHHVLPRMVATDG